MVIWVVIGARRGAASLPCTMGLAKTKRWEHLYHIVKWGSTCITRRKSVHSVYFVGRIPILESASSSDIFARHAFYTPHC